MPQLKSAEQRACDRQAAGLPILKCREDFIQRLRQQRVLVVKAETGSGKTTQLPQYCAEAFDKLVVCTQPRALAAMSIAERIADEYDGAALGSNVGFRVGSKRVNGRRIMLMTDAALIREAQRDPLLSSLSVLIVDEAHERSLNTDIVLGIARTVLKRRRDDFYVVIASATIDERPFLSFFSTFLHNPSLHEAMLHQSTSKQAHSGVLSVSGRTFPVTVTYDPTDGDDDDISPRKLLVPKIIDALHNHPDGNCLVFLPGGKEVETAIEVFRELCDEEVWIPLGLYGGMQSERQQEVMKFDDINGTRRMVVFCTNVAETSLTVPNIRLVLDTGLVKEASFDPVRRMMVLEQVYVSRSSADQRKGRAGRTASGHCIRLFDEAKLTRANIVPEIQRSSLDLVVLQLLSLGFQPRDFPLVDRPDEAHMRAAQDVLLQLSCLERDPTNAASMRITTRGRLFLDLPFDPRFSHFVVTAHEQFGSGEDAACIAACCTAPGSINFMGMDKENRKKVEARLGVRAMASGSDLLLEAGLYQKWFQAGNVQPVNGRCPACSARVRPRDGCRPCRVRFATENSLNNRVLDCVRSTIQQVLSVLTDCRRVVASPKPPGVPQEELVGRSLLLAFQEQVAECLLPDNPLAGAVLLSTRGRGVIGSTSYLTQKVRQTDSSDCLFFLTLSPREVSERLFFERNHPLRKEWLPQTLLAKLDMTALHMGVCYTSDAVNAQMRGFLQKELNAQAQRTGNPAFTFAACSHDSSTQALNVFCPKAYRDEVQVFCRAVVAKQTAELVSYEKRWDFSNGSASAILRAGLVVTKLEKHKTDGRVIFKDLPQEVTSADTLRIWLQAQHGIDAKAIQWCSVKFGNGFVAFSSDKVRSKVLSEIPNTHEQVTEPEGTRMLSVRIPQCVQTLKEVITLQGQYAEKVLASNQPTFMLKLKKIPHGVTEAAIERVVHVRPDIYSLDPSKPPGWLRNGRLFFRDPVSLAHAVASLSQAFPSMVTEPANKMGASHSGAQGFTEFKLTFSKSREAQSAYAQLISSHAEVKFCCQVYVDYSNLLDLEDIIRNVKAHPSLSAAAEACLAEKWKKPKQGGTTSYVEFSASDGETCTKAANLLTQAIKPLVFKPLSRWTHCLLQVLAKDGKLHLWARELGLQVDLENLQSQRFKTCIKVHGPQSKQGEFMRKINDFSAEFQPFYSVIPLLFSQTLPFREGKAGHERLSQIKGNYPIVTIIVSQDAGGIEVFVHPRSGEQGSLNSALADIKALLDELAGGSEDSGSTCVYCNKPDGMTLGICGHRACSHCLQQAILGHTFDRELCCNACNKPISSGDVTQVMSSGKAAQDKFEKVVFSAVLRFLAVRPSESWRLCPVADCRCLIPKQDISALYSPCKHCKKEVCFACGTVEDKMHEGVDCAVYRRRVEEWKKSGDLQPLLEEARQFAKANWSASIGPLTDITVNESLMYNCAALAQFKAAVARHPTARRFFAWHGTNREAIVPICNAGFDPARRSGQACGPGEYFGQAAATSHGYCRNSAKMVVVVILDVPGVTSTHGSFCYVVNNPIDRSASFCLPLLVLSFGNRSVSPVNFIKPASSFAPIENGSSLATSDNTKVEERMALFRWHWYEDTGMRPYNDAANSVLEDYYTQWKNGQGQAALLVSDVTRLNDDRKQDYTVHFDRMLQVNNKTGFQRKIERRSMLVPPRGNATWEYFDGVWRVFESLNQHTIEAAYQLYASGSGRSIFNMDITGRAERYQLDFARSVQINTAHGTSRQIRRRVK